MRSVPADPKNVPFEEQLRRFRELVPLLRASCFGQRLPLHLMDQFRAAGRDAWPVVSAAAAVCGLDVVDRTDEPRNTPEENEIIARILVAVAGCRPCCHLRRGSIEPGFAVLALGRVDCRRCLHTYRKPPPEDADRCDWCRRHGVTQFRAVGHQYGPLFVFGDGCPGCSAALCQDAA